MTNKVPFGFRKDIEPEPEPAEVPEEAQKEISNTGVHMERKWQPHVESPATPCDYARKRGRR